MGKRGIVVVASAAVIALSGCATDQRAIGVARLTESDVRPSALPADLVGTWTGAFGPISPGSGGDNTVGDMTLVIKEDGTYAVIERRRASTRTHSGTIVANGRTITLRSSSGGSVSLRQRGHTLYGVAHDRSGYMLQVSVEKDSGALASPPSSQRGREGGGLGVETQAP